MRRIGISNDSCGRGRRSRQGCFGNPGSADAGSGLLKQPCRWHGWIPNRMRLAALCLAALATAAAAPSTAPTTAPDGTTVVRLTLHPVPIADAPLRYPLLPPLAEQHPGDAAYNYMLALHWLPAEETADRKEPEVWADFDRVEAATADRFSPAEAAGVLGRMMSSGRFIDEAARCEQAHWENGFREHGIDTLLPQLNGMRTLARFVAVRARGELANGDFAAAGRSIQTNLSMARQLGGDGELVQSIVGAGIEDLTLGSAVTDWVSRGTSPNLYWSLTALPPSLVDPYPIAEFERAMLRFTDRPWVGLAMDDQLPPDQWPRVMRTIARIGQTYAGTRDADLDGERRRLVSATERTARDHLRSAGRPAAAVAAMSADEAVGRYLLADYQAASDGWWKAWALPYPQAVAEMRRVGPAVGPAAAAANPLIELVCAAPGRYILARQDQRLAVLRVIEALRDHAARHGGRPPASLDQVTDVPIPTDPITGRPFDYRADGATATLDLSAPTDLPRLNARYRGRVHYELTFVTP